MGGSKLFHIVIHQARLFIVLLITVFNLTAEFESLNSYYTGASERTLYFIKHKYYVFTSNKKYLQ